MYLKVKKDLKKSSDTLVKQDPDLPTDSTTLSDPAIDTTEGNECVTPASIVSKFTSKDKGIDRVAYSRLTDNYNAPLPELVVNENTLNFRMDNRTLWTTFSLGMINYSVAAFGKLDSLNSVERRLKQSASLCGEYLFPYYGISAGKKFGDHLIAMVSNGMDVVNAVSSERDFDVNRGIWAKQANETGAFLNSLNPNFWPTMLLSDMFKTLTDLWADDFVARFNKDFESDAIALDQILKVAVSGLPNHKRVGYSSIADRLSKGIIHQFPLAFIS